MSVAKIAVAIVVLVGLVSCGRPAPDRPITYRGKYHADQQASYFTQQGVDACMVIQWSVQPPDAALSGDTVIVVRGILSQPGKYGKAGCPYQLSDAVYLGHVQEAGEN